MAGLNKVMIIGNLGRDPEIRYTQSGQAVATFTVATSDEWRDKSSGEKREKTEWHRIVAWGKLGEICGQYLSKGRQVYIEGRLQTREWEDRDGNKRYTTEIVAREMVMLGSPTGGGQRGGGGPARDTSSSKGQNSDYMDAPYPNGPEDDDIPF